MNLTDITKHFVQNSKKRDLNQEEPTRCQEIERRKPD